MAPSCGTKPVLIHQPWLQGRLSWAQKGERDCTRLGLTRFISRSVLQVTEVGQSQDSNLNLKHFRPVTTRLARPCYWGGQRRAPQEPQHMYQC